MNLISLLIAIQRQRAIPRTRSDSLFFEWRSHLPARQGASTRHAPDPADRGHADPHCSAGACIGRRRDHGPSLLHQSGPPTGRHPVREQPKCSACSGSVPRTGGRFKHTAYAAHVSSRPHACMEKASRIPAQVRRTFRPW